MSNADSCSSYENDADDVDEEGVLRGNGGGGYCDLGNVAEVADPDPDEDPEADTENDTDLTGADTGTVGERLRGGWREALRVSFWLLLDVSGTRDSERFARDVDRRDAASWDARERGSSNCQSELVLLRALVALRGGRECDRE
jgi:hypothetical protein